MVSLKFLRRHVVGKLNKSKEANPGFVTGGRQLKVVSFHTTLLFVCVFRTNKQVLLTNKPLLSTMVLGGLSTQVLLVSPRLSLRHLERGIPSTYQQAANLQVTCLCSCAATHGLKPLRRHQLYKKRNII